jgi:hypothetical protein
MPSTPIKPSVEIIEFASKKFTASWEFIPLEYGVEQLLGAQCAYFDEINEKNGSR